MIKQAEFIISVADKDKVPDFNTPEIAIVGKSNVGKSSFINMMTGMSKLAKTSSEPGRTRLLNFFKINNGEFYFVDLPGYGYARVSDAEKKKWAALIEGYLTTSPNLINVFMLVDSRHEPTEDDRAMINYLYAYNLPLTVIATKADKLSRMQREKAKQVIASALAIGRDSVIMTSVPDKLGKSEVETKIDTLLKFAKGEE